MNRKELSNSYLSSFCAELSMLIVSGTAPYESVLMLFEDEPDKNGKIIMQNLLGTLETGFPLSTALSKSGYFPSYLVNMTEVGEKTGRLSESLSALSDYYDSMEHLSSDIKKAVLYPSVLLAATSSISLILIIRVLPMFNDIYVRIGGQMPSFTVRLMQLGGLLADASTIIAIITAIVAIILFATRNTIIQTMKNIFGSYGIFRKITSARFVSVMAVALKSGMLPENAAELAANAVGGSKAADKYLMQCVDHIRAGGTVSDAMLNVGIISAPQARLLSVGARSGMTDAAAAEVASKCNRETQNELEHIVGRIEPTLIIITSVIIGIILLSVMIPLINIMTTLG